MRGHPVIAAGTLGGQMRSLAQEVGDLRRGLADTVSSLNSVQVRKGGGGGGLIEGGKVRGTWVGGLAHSIKPEQRAGIGKRVEK